MLSLKEVSRLPDEGTFLQCLDEKLQAFLEGPLKDLFQGHPTCSKESVAPTSSRGGHSKSRLDDILTAITGHESVRSYLNGSEMSTAAQSDPQISFPGVPAESLLVAVESGRGSIDRRMVVVPDSNGTVPMIDFSALDAVALQSLLRLFTAVDEEDDKVGALSRNELLTRLNTEFVPRVVVETQLPDTAQKGSHDLCFGCGGRLGFFSRFARAVCSVCRKRFCSSCPRNRRLVPHMQFGRSSLQEVCKGCCATLNRKEADKWMEQVGTFLQRGDKRSVFAAYGCFAMALCSSTNWASPLFTLAKELLEHGWPEMALQIVVPAAVSDSTSTNIKAKSLLRVAAALEMLATQTDTSLNDQFGLLLAAKEAYVRAESTLLEVGDTAVEAPQLMTNKSRLDAAILTLVEEQRRQKASVLADAVMQLERLWEQRDCYGILDTLTRERNEDHGSCLLTSGIAMDALERFLAGKYDYLDRMLADDRFALILLRGILKISKRHFSEGLADVEQAAWSGCHSQWLPKVAIDVAANLLSSSSRFLSQRLYGVETVCKGLCSADFMSAVNGEVLAALLPTVEELAPPSQLHWPELVVSGINTKATRRYEESVRRQVSEGKWSERTAALAYIDFCPSSDHPAEACLSFVIAGLWFLKELQCKVEKHKALLYNGSSAGHHKLVDEEKSETSKEVEEDATLGFRDVFAVQQAVIQCMRQAYLLSTTSLHPGMQLYVLRLALKATATAMQLVNERASPEDTSLVVEMLHSLLSVCRMIPYWHFPLVTVSEAVLLNIFSGRLHSQFLLRLQHTQANGVNPITSAQLKYQLYENDLRLVWPLCNKPDPRVCAMEAMLQEKGWSWTDVSLLMTSPLSVRSEEGWLIQQPELGISMPYAELEGFSLNLSSEPAATSISLSVKMAGRDNTGLFSAGDVAEVLQLESAFAYFSLEQPSRNERFHPFQEFKYEPQGLEGTNFLHTMFETDYLLKSFSVGVEVSASPPFKQRPNLDGLTAKLPAKLRHVIRPLFERGSSLNTAHRFWIQADELVYSRTADAEGSRLEYHLGEPKMVIRSHPLMPGLDGKLHATEEGQDPDSPEAQFAADLTAHYDEIARYFPQFARLRELVKLQFLAVVIRSILENLESQANGGVTVTDSMLQTIHEENRQRRRTGVETMLQQLRTNIRVWPSADNDSEVSAAVRNIQAQLPSAVHMPYSDIESEVKRALRKNDTQLLSDVVNSLMQVCKPDVARNTMETYVSRWLIGSYPSCQDDLLRFVCSSLPLPSRTVIKRQVTDQLRAMHRSFAREVSYLKGPRQRYGQIRKTSCKWVPAALLKRQNDVCAASVCYGGVLLTPQHREGVLPRQRLSTGNTQFIRVRNTGSLRASERHGHAAPMRGTTFFDSAGASPMASSGGSGGRGGRGGGNGGGRGGGNDGDGGDGDDGKPNHQWDHVFVDKPGHVNPKSSWFTTGWKRKFEKVAENGRRSNTTTKHRLHDKAIQAGNMYVVEDHKTSTIWVRVTKKGEIRSAGVTKHSDSHVTPTSMIRYLTESTTKVFWLAQSSGIDIGSIKLSDALRIARKDNQGK